MNPVDTSKLSNLEWGEIVIEEFAEARESLTQLAIELSESDPELADAALDSADVFDTLAYQIQRIMRGSGSKKAKSKRISAFRRLYSDEVLTAVAETYDPYFA